MARIFIIAEAGVNHNGSLEKAIELIEIAADAGADAVKFQTFKAEKLVTPTAPKSEYQRKTTDKYETQFDMIKKLELNEADHKYLVDYCRKREIQFISSPFDLGSVELLAVTLDLPIIKIPSGEITNGPLLLKAAQNGKKIILSTGMSYLEEIERALGVLAFGYCMKDSPSLNGFKEAYCSDEGQNILKEKVTLLHCTTDYPAPYKDVNLRVMDTLRMAFNLPVGISDHTLGITIPIAAAALGASVIEKHFTLSRNLPGPDHKASLEPEELKQMVQAIRQVEEAIGCNVKVPALSEIKNQFIARKSLVAGRDIKRGDTFTVENIEIKRPGTGLSPMLYWELLGQVANKDYRKNEVIIK